MRQQYPGIPSWRGLHVLASWASLLLASAAFAQDAAPLVQDEFFSGQLRQRGDRLGICLWDWSATREFDRSLAHEIASVLLVEVDIYTIAQYSELTEEEMLQELWVALMDQCDIALGFTLASGIYPGWLISTAPYLLAPYVAAVASDEYERLADLPQGSLIGSQLYTQMDSQFIVALRSLGNRGWRRLPYDDPRMLLQHVSQGVIEAGIISGPRLGMLINEHTEFADINHVQLEPILATHFDPIGGVALSRDQWIVAAVDAAVAVLNEMGVISELIDNHGLIALPPQR